VQGGGSQSTRQASQSTERQNFEVSETRRERVILPGQVRKISVAVMVDGIIEKNAEGVEAWAPRPEPEIETLRTLVQSAIGFDAERGDTVTIESLQFTLAPDQGSLVESGSEGFLDLHGARLAQVGVLGVIVLALIFFVLRPMMGRQGTVDIAELTGPRPAGADPVRALAGDRDLTGEILDLPPHTVTKVERLREVITSRSEESSAVLRAWIESPEARKEHAGS
jgi:flagellar M-ring protein FliF